MDKTLSKFSVPIEELNKQKEYTELVKTVLSSRFPDRKPRAYVHTYGCQGNVADGEKLQGMLYEMGFTFTFDLNSADFVLYNTCAIREHAEDRVFGNVGALKPIKKENPELIIALCGCMMQQKQVADKIKNSYPFVDIVFGTHVSHRLPEFIYRSLCLGKEFLKQMTATEILLKAFLLSVTEPSRHGCP